MSILSFYDGGQKLLVESWIGPVTEEEYAGQLHKRLHDPLYLSFQKQIIDLRFGSIGLNFHRKNIIAGCKAILDRRASFAKQEIAVIAGLGFLKTDRLVQILHSASIHVIMFNHMDTACDWLNVDVVDVDRILRQMHHRHKAEVQQQNRLEQDPSGLPVLGMLGS
jgi:hypothetical protein